MPKATVSRRSKRSKEPWGGFVEKTTRVPMRPRDPRYRNNWEQMLGDADPTYEPPTDEEIEQSYGGMQAYNAWVLSNMTGPGETFVNIIGNRPNRGVTEDVHIVSFPDSQNLCIRVFPGGFEEFGQYFIEFFDLTTRAPVRAPASCEFISNYRPGSLCMPGKLVTWQKTWGFDVGENSTEMYAVPEGSMWELRRPGKPHVRFSIPIRVQARFPVAIPYVA
ncbi:hypothetical protein PLICRDRAFT_57480 [Plicaturopsis crispa FD-325 SS-3]|uniref:Uncharacterized protein n=1 Tax=Plicaturopsis crispa FD-325 SS-3 TaxID=944288 RepID=A0A0C9SYD9_PLICR|nr:hypothetical protein PLICRDRAFT_57480 [Plicaturopsis crispa FD-325 SS-3]